MCGVPYHAAESYISRLIRAGHKVCICGRWKHQAGQKKLVRRGDAVWRGTALARSLIEPKENNYLAAIYWLALLRHEPNSDCCPSPKRLRSHLSRST